ncbi:hypothetical protein DACRYDRAFT_23876 [Dacryopinax primogenitus]|uniref:Glyoxylate reductase n=1 Tax=Dacryopinax primogenitus (strain DJM 731) TaxID=1858805 RepID=M5FTB4_DACPD|nr:uncharacterized protein DACRYDRAFT_23876 [Dacryopinax primogenitus]EJT99278.1 hypothetical protein DACRYDRAFT_23876 [Dacryopinax primogenitus]
MSKTKILVCRDIGDKSMAVLRAQEDWNLVIWPHDRPADKEWVYANAPGSVGMVVTLGEKVTEELVALTGPQLKVVSTMSVGVDHVELPALASRHIRLGYTPDVLTDAVADCSIMLALMASRNVTSSQTLLRSGTWGNLGWGPYLFCGPQIGAGPGKKESTVGFLGFGRISQATLVRIAAFGVTRCVYYNSGRKDRSAEDQALADKLGLKEVKRVELDELARSSDVLFTLVPGGKDTFHIVDEAFLRKMKPTSVLVNTGRGPIVDTQALVKALKEGWIWGAGLDVVEGEPNIPADHPLLHEPRCAIIPHIASATIETREAMAMLCATNLVGGLKEGKIGVEYDLS